MNSRKSEDVLDTISERASFLRGADGKATHAVIPSTPNYVQIHRGLRWFGEGEGEARRSELRVAHR